MGDNISLWGNWEEEIGNGKLGIEALEILHWTRLPWALLIGSK
jgi:hypothetical protein